MYSYIQYVEYSRSVQVLTYTQGNTYVIRKTTPPPCGAVFRFFRTDVLENKRGGGGGDTKPELIRACHMGRFSGQGRAGPILLKN